MVARHQTDIVQYSQGSDFAKLFHQLEGLQELQENIFLSRF